MLGDASGHLNLSDTHREVERHVNNLDAQFQLLTQQVQHLQRLSALGTLSAVLAHEFNNMLTPVVAHCQYALHRNEPELTQAALERTLKSAKRLAAFCERILAMASSQETSPTAAPIKPVLIEAIDCLGRDLSKDDITLHLYVDDALAARFVQTSLAQVFFNVLLNARQAMAGGPGTLTVSAQRSGENVEILFRDSGPGLNPDAQERIFQPFFSTKTHEQRPERGGVGLGLYICKRLMNDQSGDITVQSKPGQGAVFTVTLPSA